MGECCSYDQLTCNNRELNIKLIITRTGRRFTGVSRNVSYLCIINVRNLL